MHFLTPHTLGTNLRRLSQGTVVGLPDGGVGGFIGVYATIISAVNVINNGNVINQIAVI